MTARPVGEALLRVHGPPWRSSARTVHAGQDRRARHDRHEQKADAFAAALMGIHDTSMTDLPRGCNGCTTDTTDRGSSSLTPCRAAHIADARVPGRPLPHAERAFFEPRFGYDFGQVLVHTDPAAAEAARAVRARAFTSGRDIVFDAGHYAPSSSEGRRVLAHELAHVVQQEALGTRDATVASHGLRSPPPKTLQRLPENPGGNAADESAAGIATQPEVPHDWMVLPFPMATWHEITKGTQLSPEETERRRKLLEASAIKVAPNYPWAAALLLRWLASNATEQLLNLSPEQLLREDSGFPTAVRTKIRDVLRGGVEARLDEAHPEHLVPGQRELHLRGTGSFEFIGPNQNHSTLPMLQKDLSIALGGVSYTVDAQLSLHWTGDALTTAKVVTAQISIVDHYDFNLDDLAMVPLPPGVTMPEDITVAPLPPGISIEDLPIPEEVVQTSMSFNGQEWIVVKDQWLSDIAFSGGAVNYPLRIDAFDIPSEMFAPFTVSGAMVK